MTGPEHFQEAERIITMVSAGELDASVLDRSELLIAAQVLALAAATALNVPHPGGGMENADSPGPSSTRVGMSASTDRAPARCEKDHRPGRDPARRAVRAGPGDGTAVRRRVGRGTGSGAHPPIGGSFSPGVI
jgi:hypothetical protein